MRKYISITCLLFLTCSIVAQINQKDNFVSIPLGGNSYLNEYPNQTKVKDEGVFDWSDTNTIISTYIYLKNSGDLDLFLNYGLQEGSSDISLCYEDQKLDIKLSSTSTPDSMIYLGQLKNLPQGYVKLDLKGIQKEGKYFAIPRKFSVIENGKNEIVCVNDFEYYWGRRGPSVHMNYKLPTEIEADWFYNEVFVPIGYDHIGSYFMANGFGEGYFGMQVNSPNERRILFSVWSPFVTDKPNDIPEDHKIIMKAKGEDVKTGEFGNEGSGGQSYWRYNWKAGETYKFLTHIVPVENNYTEYTAYFFEPQKQEWKLIAKFLRPQTQTFYTHPHSFLENFYPDAGSKERIVYFDNQWIHTTDGRWIELNDARFTADNTARAGARLDYAGGLKDDKFYLRNGGFFNDSVKIGSIFHRNSKSTQPSINLEKISKTN